MTQQAKVTFTKSVSRHTVRSIRDCITIILMKMKIRLLNLHGRTLCFFLLVLKTKNFFILIYHVFLLLVYTLHL